MTMTGKRARISTICSVKWSENPRNEISATPGWRLYGPYIHGDLDLLYGAKTPRSVRVNDRLSMSIVMTCTALVVVTSLDYILAGYSNFCFCTLNDHGRTPQGRPNLESARL